jgi:outer membrane protein assembly factor BamB
VTELPAQSFTRQWSLDLFPQGQGTVEWVRTAGDFLIAFTSERRAYVIDKNSGRLITIHEIQNPGEVLAPFTNGKVIAYPVSTNIELFDLTGARLRSINLGVAVQSTGVMSDTTIYIAVSGSNGGRMRAVDPKRTYDTPKWEVMAFGPVTAAPIFFDQTLFFANNMGKVFAVNESRSPVWALEGSSFQAGPVLADLKADEYGLYVASTDSKLLCLNRLSGKIRWQYFAGEALEKAAIPLGDLVYLPVPNQGLVAIPRTEGDYTRKPKWTSRESTMLLAEDSRFVYTRLRGNSIGALDKAAGTVVFRSPRSDLDFFVTNTGKDGLVLAGTRKGYIVAIKPVTRPGTVGELMFTSEK